MKPFLRWAGGKNWLKKYLPQIINNQEFNNYHEPFIGGGSVFFHLENKNDTFISDINEPLINAYKQVRDKCEKVINYLKYFENTESFYYDIRNKTFEDPSLSAAQFIFLNQTSYNGIYRVNLNGKYNVPFGRRKKDFLDVATLELCSNKLANTKIFCHQFDMNLEQIKQNDLVFLDPPYTITHNNNGFIKYNEKLFSINDQYRLSTFIDKIIEKKAYYILTNAAHVDIKNIFNQRKPIILNRASLISGKSSNRGNYEEFLFTNIENEFIEANRY